jgi:hypothetical protein
MCVVTDEATSSNYTGTNLDILRRNRTFYVHSQLRIKIAFPV